MNLFKYIQCLLRGRHDWTNSKAKRGYQTCQRCRVRTKF